MQMITCKETINMAATNIKTLKAIYKNQKRILGV